MANMTCPKCSASMVPGFATALRAGGFHNVYTQPEFWVSGPAEPSLWTGSKVSGKEAFTLIAYRCTGCAFVEIYAPDVAPT